MGGIVNSFGTLDIAPDQRKAFPWLAIVHWQTDVRIRFDVRHVSVTFDEAVRRTASILVVGELDSVTCIARDLTGRAIETGI